MIVADEAREIAEGFIATQETREGVELQFRSVEDRGSAWHVLFDKVFVEPTIESPAYLVVRVDKESRQPSWVYQE